MAAFPRSILPARSSPWIMPGSLLAFSQSGKVQARGTVQTGRRWREVYKPFKITSIAGRAFLTEINRLWRGGIQFDTEHYGYLTQLGGGTGSPLVNGANQTGSTLNTDTWTGSNPVLRAGDIIRIAGISQIFEITADAPNLAAGAVALGISPPIFAGGSPADNAAITRTAVRLNAIICEAPIMPDFTANEYVMDFALSFAEVV